MRRLLILFGYGIGLYVLLLVHLVVLYIFPAPWSSFNVLIAASALHVVGSPNHDHLLLVASIVYSLALDAFGGSVFGLLVIGMPITIYALTFLYYRVFTNRSWYSTAMLAGAGVVMFRALYLALLYLFSFISEQTLPQYNTLLSGFLWELVVTTGFTALAAIVLSLYSSKFRTDNQVYWQS